MITAAVWVAAGRVNTSLQALIPEPSIQLLNDLAENSEAKVAVMEMSSRSKALHMPGSGVALKDGGSIGKTGAVREQMMRGDGPVRHIHREPGEIFEHGPMKVHFALTMQLQHDQRREGLGNGADLKKLVWRHRRFQLYVRKAIARGTDGWAVCASERLGQPQVRSSPSCRPR